MNQKLTKQELKSLRDTCFELWSFNSFKTPSWLHKRAPTLIQLCQESPVHGLLHRWLPPILSLREAIDANPELSSGLSYRTDSVSGRIVDPSIELLSNTTLHNHLINLKPWRKGPWQLNDTEIQSEWNSSIKYKRLQDYGPNVRGKTLLDIGCGNGYYGFRMLGDDAAYVLGVDPSPLFWAQFSTFKALSPNAPIDMLPIAGEPLMDLQLQFDVVLSMGVLYHRRNPLDHLKLLKQCVTENGEVLLETLIIDGNDNQLLMPEKTYGGMPNIWGLPSLGLLTQWLQFVGFKDIECVSLSLTNLQEQQQTSWVDTHSLEDFLSACGTRTKEGYPAPWRVMMKAKK